MYVTDVWEDIRELTSGYYAGDEALRDAEGNRLHKQQTPIQLLIRIILSSTYPGDLILDPFAGSGTTLVVSQQLGRKSIGIEIDANNVEIIQNRLSQQKKSDDVSRFLKDYACTPDLELIWGILTYEIINLLQDTNIRSDVPFRIKKINGVLNLSLLCGLMYKKRTSMHSRKT